MTDRELVQQALDAFGGLLVFNPSPAEYKQGRDVVAALRDRLAQPEQELVIDCPRCGHCCPKSNQEPVAWRTFDGEGGYDYRNYEDNEQYAKEWEQRNPKYTGWVEPLYGTPLPSTWFGLTDEEVKHMLELFVIPPQHIEMVVQAIEAKLKEKNT